MTKERARIIQKWGHIHKRMRAVDGVEDGLMALNFYFLFFIYSFLLERNELIPARQRILREIRLSTANFISLIIKIDSNKIKLNKFVLTSQRRRLCIATTVPDVIRPL